MKQEQLEKRVVKGSFFLRSSLLSMLDDPAVYPIMQVINEKVAQIKQCRVPEFTYYFFRQRGKETIHISISIGPEIKESLDFVNVNGLFKLKEKKNDQEGMSFSTLKTRLNYYLKPSRVPLTDEQVEKVSNFIEEFGILSRTALSDYRFFISNTDSDFNIEAKYKNNPSDRLLLDLH